MLVPIGKGVAVEIASMRSAPCVPVEVFASVTKYFVASVPDKLAVDVRRNVSFTGMVIFPLFKVTTPLAVTFRLSVTGALKVMLFAPLFTAEKKDSQGICFVGKVRCRAL